MELVREPFSREENLACLEEHIRDWFTTTFRDLTPPQRFSFKLVGEGHNVLITAPTGSGKCVTPDTDFLLILDGKPSLISGRKLLKLIKEKGKLVHEFNDKEKLFAIEGLKAFSLTPELTIELFPCFIFLQDYEGDILEIETKCGRRIRLSPDHPLLVEDRFWEFKWKPARELEVGQRIAVPKEIKLPQTNTNPFNLTKAIRTLKRRARIVLKHEDYKQVMKSLFEDPTPSPEILEKARVLCKLSYKEICEKIKVGTATLSNIFHGKSKFKLKALIQLLRDLIKKVSFSPNELVVQEFDGNVCKFKYPINMDEKLAKWVSFILAEGHIHHKREGSFILISQKRNKKLLSEFLQLTQELFSLKFRQKGAIDWVLSSTPFVEFIVKYLGLGSGRSRRVGFPDWVFCLDEGALKSFLRWFISLEAEIRRGQIRVVQSSKTKINALAYLLLSFGIFPSLGRVIKCATNTKEKIKRTYYTLALYGIKNIKKLLSEIGLEGIEEEKLKELHKFLNVKSSGQQIGKFSFDYRDITRVGKILGLSRSHLNDEFKLEFGNIYEVTRRSGYITQNALSVLLSKVNRLEGTRGSDEWLRDLKERINLLLNSPLSWVGIESIRKRRYKGKLLDLFVPFYGNFIGGTGGIFLHNTFACFMIVLSKLFELGKKKRLKDGIYCIYVSPLRALDNDIWRNLMVPLTEIKEKWKDAPEIRIAIRTGDISAYEKQKQLKQPPHILITTPETLAILLNSPRFKEHLKTVRWVVIDEIHELAPNKRGAHLSLSLERLREYVGKEFQRIGLGATLHPLEEAAKFLVGYDNKGRLRDCKLVDVTWFKPFDLKVICPVKDLIHTSAEGCNEALYRLLDQLISSHRTTLVFTNTRSGTERVVYNLMRKWKDKYTDETIGAHHGSLSRDIRWRIEERLKRGLMRAVICLKGNTKILTSTGDWVPIRKLKETEVQCINSSLKIENAKVLRKFRLLNRGRLIKLKTKFGKEIECTEDHKFLTLNKKGDLEWKEAALLKKGDFVATIRGYNYEKLKDDSLFAYYPAHYFAKLNKRLLKSFKKKIATEFGSIKKFWREFFASECSYSKFLSELNGIYCFKIGRLRRIADVLKIGQSSLFKNFKQISSGKYKMPPLKLTSNLLRLLGFMMADGYFSENALFFSSRDERLLTYYAKVIKKLSSKEPSWKLSSTGTPVIFWQSKFLCDLLKRLGFQMGRKARKAKVPSFIFRLDSDKVFSFLSGYFDGNGHLEIKNNRVYAAGFSTTSKEMAHSLAMLLLKEGILTSIRSRHYNEVQTIEDYSIKKKGFFYSVIVLGGESLRKFAKKISPVRERLKRIKEVISLKGYCNQDVVPNIGFKLKQLREKRNISAYKLWKIGLGVGKYEVGVRNPTKERLKRLLHEIGRDEYLCCLANSDLWWEPIKSKEITGSPKFVYTLEVKEKGNYIANGFIVQNCSTSLELGIDIGYIDLVVQIGSPKSVTRAVQRIGRSGHGLEDTAKGRIVVLDRDDLIECAILLACAKKRVLDEIEVIKCPLDVLAQHIVGMALNKKWKVRDALRLIRRSYCFNELKEEQFIRLLRYLAGHYEELEYQQVYGKIWFDEADKIFGRRGKYTRLIYFLNIGTIPDEVKIDVYKLPERWYVGGIEEGFLERLRPGDIFVLGGKLYRFRYARSTSCYVEPVKDAVPTIPTWFSELLPLTWDAASRVREFRERMKEMLKERREEVVEWLLRELPIDEQAANSIYEYMMEQHSYAQIPSRDELLIERTFDLEGRKYVVFHALFGRRVNDALSRAIAFLASNQLKSNVVVMVSDNGFALLIPREKELNLSKLLFELERCDLREVIEKTLERTEMIHRRFRHCASRSFLVLRNYKGHKISVSRQQTNAQTLLKVCKQIDERFPIVEETKREILEDVMDIKRAELVIKWLKEKELKPIFISTEVPSPFAHNLILLGEADIIRMEDRKKRLMQLYEAVKKRIPQ